MVWMSVLMSFVAAAQAQPAKDSIGIIDGVPIEVGVQVTTNLIFHYKIRQVDRGSGALLAKIGNDTVLFLKAGSELMPPTNLSVYTGDGKLHAFVVRYAQAPVRLWMRLEGVTSSAPAGPTSVWTEDSLTWYGEKAAATHGRPYVRTQKDGLCWALRSVFARNDRLFFTLYLSNASALDYKVGSVRFLVRDRQQGKRRAVQERPLDAVFHLGTLERVPADSAQVGVWVLPSFALQGKRALRIKVTEMNGGGRDLYIDLGCRRLAKMKRL